MTYSTHSTSRLAWHCVLSQGDDEDGDDNDDDNELQLVTSQLSLNLIIHWLLCDKVIMK